MPTTHEAAYEVTSTRFKTEWEANTPNFYTGAPAPPIRWDGFETGEIPKTYFCRFSMKWVLENQRTFRNGDDQRYVAAGVLFIQVFGPRKDDKLGATRTSKLATIAQKVFRGKTFDGGVKFRRVRVVDLDPLDGFHRANVAMEFEYDEIG